MLTAALSTYAKVAQVSGGIALAIFTARLSLSAALISQPAQYGQILKDLVTLFVALALFPLVFKSIISVTGSIANHLAVGEVVREEGTIDQLWAVFADDNLILETITNLLPIAIDHIARAIYSVLLGAICAVAPIILIYQFMTGQGSGVAALTYSVLTLTSWPILWNAIGLFGKEVWPSFAETSLASVCFWAAIKVFQLLSPLFAAMFFKGFSVSGASKSAKVVTVIKKVVMKS